MVPNRTPKKLPFLNRDCPHKNSGISQLLIILSSAIIVVAEGNFIVPIVNFIFSEGEGFMKKMVCLFFLIVMFGIMSGAHAGDIKSEITVFERYYDMATGHQYIRNQDGTFSEYSRKGRLLKSSVPNTLPLLVRGKHIRSIDENSYIMYQRYKNNDFSTMVQPASQPHPMNGWRCFKLLSSNI